ncbi:MAG: PQQ-binding-like beta-propeller repeat protein [Verrucomicrobiota bacterium]
MKTLQLLAASIAFGLVSSSTMLADWTQFRGANLAGMSEESVPVSWSAEENLKWKTKLPGMGSSSPIVSGDAVFITSYTGEGGGIQRHLTRIDRTTGEVVWDKTVPVWHTEDPPRGYITEHGYASNTPVTDGTAVYCYFGKAGVYAFDFEGNQLWKAETGKMSSGKKWGSASSPILYEDLVIIPAGDELRAILALNKADGKEVWRAEGDRMEQTYGSPLLVKVDESRTDLVYALAGEFWGLNPSSGKLRWFAEYNLPGNMSNSPVLSGDVITISGGFPRTARVAIKVGGKGDRSGEILYDTQKPATYMTAPVGKDGVLYWVSDSGIAFAAKAGESEPLFEERVPGISGGRGKAFYASPILAGGKIYAQSRYNGLFVIEPASDGLEVVSHNKLGDETAFNGTPAVSGGNLFVRSQTHLYCIGE